MFIAPPAISRSSHISKASISTEPLRQVLNLSIRGIEVDSQESDREGTLAMVKKGGGGVTLRREKDEIAFTTAEPDEDAAPLDREDETKLITNTSARRGVPRYKHYDRTTYMIVQPRVIEEPPVQDPEPQPQDRAPSDKNSLQLDHLPGEIQETILESLLGSLGSISCSRNDGSHGTKDWSSIMRHPRRRQVTDLALVSPLWRRVVQQRIYRHVKIKGTTKGLENCSLWFFTHPHLQEYVRHIEIWVPVWEERAGRHPHVGFSMENENLEPPPQIPLLGAETFPEGGALNQVFKIATHNATLSEIFGCVQTVFPAACILTIEGGHCKKPPLVRYFRTARKLDFTPGSCLQALPRLPRVTTFILKGAWNLIRDSMHYTILSAALPALREWHCTFAKPKIQAYHMISAILISPAITPHISHLNLCLEGFYTKDAPDPAKMLSLQQSHHLCASLGKVLPQLEALTYTGRVCACLFTTAVKTAAERSREFRLKSVDLIVKNCCRALSADEHIARRTLLSTPAPTTFGGMSPVWLNALHTLHPTLNFHSPTQFAAASAASSPASALSPPGYRNYAFIQAFDALIRAAALSLSTFTELTFIRMRYLDLDSPCPALNPYWQLKDGKCQGLWSDGILAAMWNGRAGIDYDDLEPAEKGMRLGPGQIGKGVGRRGRARRTEDYKEFADAESNRGIQGMHGMYGT